MDKITYYNRYTQEIEEELVYGRKFLEWTYHSPFAKIPLHLMVKKPFFSKFYGWRMNQPKTAATIPDFIKHYKLKVSDFLDSPSEYKNFNEFFYRRLKTETRPIATSKVVFPADGRHLGFPDISQIKNFFVKGQSFNLKAFLDDDTLYRKFATGSMVLSRLCPTDYHRYHFPVSGLVKDTRLINGPLFSVSPIALKKQLSYLWQNKRAITIIETETLGSVAVVEIGATCVGSIHQTYNPHSSITKGDEKGYFSFGGSSVMTIFEADKIQLSQDLLENSAKQVELYALMGDTLANSL